MIPIQIQHLVAEATAIGNQVVALQYSSDEPLTIERLALARFARICDILETALRLLNPDDPEEREVHRSVSNGLAVFISRVVTSAETCKRLEAQEMAVAAASTLH